MFQEICAVKLLRTANCLKSAKMNKKYLQGKIYLEICKQGRKIKNPQTQAYFYYAVPTIRRDRF